MSEQTFPLIPFPRDWPDDQADLVRRHRESLFPSVGLNYSEPIELRYGERQYVWDGAGRQYLDFFGGIVTTSSGHAIPEITGPIKEQLDNIIHSSTLFLIRAQIELAERIKANSPFGVWMTKEVMWSNLETGSLQRYVASGRVADLPGKG